MNEAQLQQAVIELARTLGWRVAHFRAAMTTKGYRTPVEADGKGFPDLVLVRRERLLFVELKAGRGSVSAEQQAWLQALATAGVAVRIWWPVDWTSGTIETALR